MLPAGKTILFTSRAGIGTAAILRSSACTNQGFQSFVVHDDTDVNFIFAMIPAIKRWACVHASGSTFLEISGKALASMSICAPCLSEQKMIGSVFSDFDTLITLHQRKEINIKAGASSILPRHFTDCMNSSFYMLTPRVLSVSAIFASSSLISFLSCSSIRRTSSRSICSSSSNVSTYLGILRL